MAMSERQTFWNGQRQRPEINATEAMLEILSVRRAKGSVKRVKFFPSGLSESLTCQATQGVGFDDWEDFPQFSATVFGCSSPIHSDRSGAMH